MQGSWDLETQEFHGGQSWRGCDDFVTDFSVTTNAFGPPKSALRAAVDSLSHVQHYPSADASEARDAVSRFCDWSPSRMLVGNGASEFIDLIMKALPEGPFCPAPYIATYQEYHRAARAAGRQILVPDRAECEDNDDSKCTAFKDASVVVYIRPNSPTGQCVPLAQLEKVLETTTTNIIVDESFLPFFGPKWRDLSALNLIDRFPKRLIVIHSWTKLWSCAGLRLGSVCASSDWIKEMKRLQTPWSCNSMAQAFAIGAATDQEYMEETWRSIRQWRAITMKNVLSLGWKEAICSGEWVPWVLVQCPSKEVASRASKTAFSVGCPVRHCASYGLPDHVRIAVRQPEYQEVLFSELRKHFGVDGHPEK